MRKLKLYLGVDDSPECPMDWDGAWTLVSFAQKHHNFQYPDSIVVGDLEFSVNRDGSTNHVGVRRKLTAGTAFILSYYEHGNCSWFLPGMGAPGTDCPWDGVTVAGILIWDHPVDGMGSKTYEDRKKDAAAFLQGYTAWCNGEVYGFSLEDEHGDHVDGCYGFYDVQQMFDEMQMEKDDEIVEVTGPADVLVNYYDVKNLTATV